MIIDDIKVDDLIFIIKFACDYEACKGACCWAEINGVDLLGGGIQQSEAKEISRVKRTLAHYCSKDMQHSALEPIQEVDGEYYTTTQNGCCIYCNKERKTCALKLAHSAGKLSFDIPRDCHLYPLIYENGELKFSQLFESHCKAAYEKGERESIYLLQFCKDPICRTFGEKFYNKLLTAQKLFR